jgi:hypothetical protein
MRDWRSANLPGIWSLIEGENFCTGQDRVLDWDNLAIAVREQHRSLEAQRKKLAEAWPPELNQSANKFLQAVDALSDSMKRTLDRAEQTKTGLNGVIAAINEAQVAIRPLVDERAEVSGDVTPRWIDHAEDKYDAKAQAIMAKAETDVSRASAVIQAPSLFAMSGYGREEEKPVGSGNGGGASTAGGGGDGVASVRATPVPAPLPSHVPSWAADPADAPTSSHPSTPATTPPHGSTGPSPDLASTDPPAPAPTGPGGVSPIGSANPSLSTPLTGGFGGPGMVIGGPGAVPGGRGGIGRGLGAGARPGGVAGMRPGGVIGGMPIAGGVVGRDGATPVRRVMPSGGVIGASNLSGGVRAQSGSAGGGRSSVGMPMQAGRRGGGVSGDDVINGEADQLWQTETGVDPVIGPKDDFPNHDPGPGVIGGRA